jgi:hypothetical protein
MAEQAKLFIYNKKTDELHVAVSHDMPLLEEIKEKSEQPQYDKFYSLYAFDEVSYHRLLKDYINHFKLESVYKIPYEERKKMREDCYIKDIYGDKMPKGDEKHIFRIATLNKLNHKLYVMYLFSFEVLHEVDNIGGILFYHEDQTAEIDGFQNKSIKERIQSIIMLMRELKKCNRTKICVDKVKERFGV